MVEVVSHIALLEDTLNLVLDSMRANESFTINARLEKIKSNIETLIRQYYEALEKVSISCCFHIYLLTNNCFNCFNLTI